MKKLLAALIAAMLATPAMACTDWKAVAAFDAVIAANNAVTRVEEDIKFIDSMGTAKIDDINQNTLNEHRELDDRSRAAVQEHLTAALADTCQENTR
jgi:hypothetical protein